MDIDIISDTLADFEEKVGQIKQKGFEFIRLAGELESILHNLEEDTFMQDIFEQNGEYDPQVTDGTMEVDD